MSRRAEEQDRTKSRGRPEGLPKRWSARRKAEVVLRLLRGEDIGEVSREIRVAPPELERWRREFLEGGQQGLRKGKNRPGGELMRTRAKLGETDDAGRVAGGASRKKGVRGRAEEALEAVGRVSPATNRPIPADDGVRDLAGGAFERVRVAGQARRPSGARSPAAREAGPEDGPERRGASAGDPDGAEGESVPRRGPPR